MWKKTGCAVAVVTVGLIALPGLYLLYWFAMLQLDTVRVVNSLTETEGLTHLDYCGWNRNDHLYHVAYLDQDSIGKPIEEVTINELIGFITQYSQQNYVDTNQLVSVIFCNKCTLLPRDPDYHYDEVWEIKRSEYLIDFHFTNRHDSVSIRDKIWNMTFWNHGKQSRYREDSDGRKLVNVDSIGDYSLEYFYRTR